MTSAIEPHEIEIFRPLLPVGYETGVVAYQSAAAKLSARDLTTHYTEGLHFFHDKFVPFLKRTIEGLTGGVWDLSDHAGFAAGSDCDFMSHLVEAVAIKEQVKLYPGDWYGFLVGCTQTNNISFDDSEGGELACICVPSVRNGHFTEPMFDFLNQSNSCLLNLNLFPTMRDEDRASVARELQSLLPKSILSISFSRGFGLTASQLGVVLVPKSHPYCSRFATQWNWFTYFYNSLAARAFLEFDIADAQKVDAKRFEWVKTWLSERDLPALSTGSYYVRSFRVTGNLPEYFAPLQRDNVVRLCFKPPQI